MSTHYVLFGDGSSEPIDAISDVLCGHPLRENNEILVDLRGDGGHSIVFVQVGGGARCVNGTVEVYEYVSGRWIKPSSVPERASDMLEINYDGIPDFSYDLFSFYMGEAPWIPLADWSISVRGFESWDGQQYSRRASRFADWYRAEYERSLDSAKEMGGNQSCAEDRLATAANIYVYGTLLGHDERALLRQVNRLVQNRPTRPCWDSANADWPSAIEFVKALRAARAELLKIKA